MQLNPSSLGQLLQSEMKSNFSLAERNEISEKCFSHTPLGPGYRSCDLCGRQLFLLRPPLPTSGV